VVSTDGAAWSVFWPAAPAETTFGGMTRPFILLALLLPACAYGPTGGYDPETEEPIQRANVSQVEPSAPRERQVLVAPVDRQRADMEMRQGDGEPLVLSAE
jgi:hypothetical protein